MHACLGTQSCPTLHFHTTSVSCSNQDHLGFLPQAREVPGEQWKTKIQFSASKLEKKFFPQNSMWKKRILNIKTTSTQ